MLSGTGPHTGSHTGPVGNIHIGNKIRQNPEPQKSSQTMCLSLYCSMDGFGAWNIFVWTFEDFKKSDLLLKRVLY